jgi:NADPH:quinone reductase-like Zn-dependent oxidoreductase
VVVEVGGDGTLGRSVASIRPGGAVAIVGGVDGWATEIEIQPVLMRVARLMGIFVGSRAMLEDLNRFVTAAKIRPTIDRVFSFDQAREYTRTWNRPTTSARS